MIEQSTAAPTVVQLIGAVMREVTAVKKRDTNSHFGFTFRGIDTVLDSVAPALRDHGVVIIPTVRDKTMEKDGKNNRVVLTVDYTFYGPAGDHITATVVGEAMDAQDKATSKAMSVAFRIALLQCFAIPTGERDPHAGAPITTKLAALKTKVWKQAQSRGWDMNQLREEFTLWSGGADIEVATEKDLTDYLKHLDPSTVTTMQRRQP
ncbi:ERF family protein [Crossiella sp. SN42]|uniref:ERF family protein n=1 Tax=Crossiella sp. SN42 TaxID=2944808 RepID=UPI00207C631E|nr:ERF family protein [Crossiella sp. SN42]MCO1575001.1 ERF family protein [Crossiella sp. SN42]